MLESPNDHVIDYESTKANNKNLIRAVYTKNHKLLEECLKKENFLSTLFQRWGVDTDFNAIEIAIKNKDKKAIQEICRANKNQNFKFAPAQASGLNSFNTGTQSVFAYGAHTRHVQMGKGNKELNNAFNKDEGHYGPFDHVTIERIIESDVDPEILDLLRVEVENMDHQIAQSFQTAVVSGNFKVAAYIAEKLAPYVPLAQLHIAALTLTDAKNLNDFRKPSVTAKVMNSAITPIHCACINPNTEILEAFLSKVPEYSIGDFQMRKPIHYAAASQTPDALKILIGKSVDYREGTKGRLTPLMIACQYGREKNVEVLLGEGDDTILTAKTRDSMMAQHWAAERGHLNCLKLLHKKGADLNQPGR